MVGAINSLADVDRSIRQKIEILKPFATGYDANGFPKFEDAKLAGIAEIGIQMLSGLDNLNLEPEVHNEAYSQVQRGLYDLADNLESAGGLDGFWDVVANVATGGAVAITKKTIDVVKTGAAIAQKSKLFNVITGGVFTVTNWVQDKAFQAIKSVRDGLVNAWKWTAATIPALVKKIGAAIVAGLKWIGSMALKLAFLVPRLAFLGLVRINFVHLATKLAPGLQEKDEAIRLGYDMAEWEKSSNRTKRILTFWTAIGGSANELATVIMLAVGNPDPQQPATNEAPAGWEWVCNQDDSFLMYNGYDYIFGGNGSFQLLPVSEVNKKAPNIDEPTTVTANSSLFGWDMVCPVMKQVYRLKNSSTSVSNSGPVGWSWVCMEGDETTIQPNSDYVYGVEGRFLLSNSTFILKRVDGQTKVSVTSDLFGGDPYQGKQKKVWVLKSISTASTITSGFTAISPNMSKGVFGLGSVQDPKDLVPICGDLIENITDVLNYSNKVNAFLNLVRLNYSGLASKLLPVYQNHSDLDTQELSKLIVARVKIESLIVSIGGDASQLRAAVLEGAGKNQLNGLGDYGVSATITAAAAILAKVYSWLKDVDLAKLVKNCKTVADLFKKKTPESIDADQKKAATEVVVDNSKTDKKIVDEYDKLANQYGSDGLVENTPTTTSNPTSSGSTAFSSTPTNSNPSSSGSPAFANTNKSIIDPQPDIAPDTGSKMPIYIGVGVLAAGVIYVMSQDKPKGRGRKKRR